jgi:hypothetical protein
MYQINSSNIYRIMNYQVGVDSIACAHFLMFMCYWQMGSGNKMFDTLATFEKCISETREHLCHVCTDLNLLAQCKYMVGDVSGALRYLKQSLDKQPSYMFNAAPWILGVMLVTFHADITQRLTQLALTC